MSSCLQCLILRSYNRPAPNQAGFSEGMDPKGAGRDADLLLSSVESPQPVPPAPSISLSQDKPDRTWQVSHPSRYDCFELAGYSCDASHDDSLIPSYEPAESRVREDRGVHVTRLALSGSSFNSNLCVRALCARAEIIQGRSLQSAMGRGCGILCVPFPRSR